jgi:DNA-binding NtrC family response regulator
MTRSPTSLVDATTGSMQVEVGPVARRARRPGLVVLYAEGFRELPPAFALGAPEVLIGRDPQAGICIPQLAVSRAHARVLTTELPGGAVGFRVLDLGGRNGTIVDGRFVTEAVLDEGAELRVGDAIMKLVLDDVDEHARFRVDGWVFDAPMLGGAPGGQSSAPSAGHWSQASRPELVGGLAIERIAASLDRVAKTGISVMLLGESGTGKEVLAARLHRASARRGVLQAINCAALPATLLESELFGYKRGAFSGADRDKAGLVRAADGGTLFLDEVGDMPLEAQAKLLRVLQSREVVPVGATSPERVDVRVVCATHRDLKRLVQEGRFRGDLYARLFELSVRVPPLRERKEDVYMLVRAFLEKQGRADLTVSFAYLTGLLHYDFPFNVRELEAFVKRAAALADAPELDARHLPDDVRELMQSYGQRAPHPTEQPSSREAHASASAAMSAGSSGSTSRSTAGNTAGNTSVNTSGSTSGSPHGDPRRAPSAEELTELLTRHRGNVTAISREVGKERMQVHRWMKRYGLDPERFR